MGWRLRLVRWVHVMRLLRLTACVLVFVMVFVVANAVVLQAYWTQRRRQLAERRAWRQPAPRPRPADADAFLQRLRNSVRVGDRFAFNCADFPTMKVGRRLGAGWSKEVFAGELAGRAVAVKKVNVHGQNMHRCLAAGVNHTACYQHTALKMYREVRLLHQLPHPNIIELYGFCTSAGRGDSSVAVMVTELGAPLSQLALLQTGWERRLRLALDAATLLSYLAASPLGPASLSDLRLEQFVDVDGRLKLTDLDDLQLGEPACDSPADCLLPLPAAADHRLVRCVTGRCQGYNLRRNQALAARELFSPLLEVGVPPNLNASVAAVVAGYSAADRSAATMRRSVQLLVEQFRREGYGVTDVGSAVYEPMANSTLPGHNYQCGLSAELELCAMSVSGQDEAAALCSADERCEGFVITGVTTWTGRQMTHFKTRTVTGEVQPEVNSTLFIRQATR